MSGNYQTIVHPLEPVYNKNSKILILGSFPSIKTREYGFFYGHPQNRFWPLMEELFKIEIKDDIGEKRKFLFDHEIGLYDAIYQCEIIGSADSTIRNAVPTNLKEIIRNSNINKVFCNGTASFNTYKKYQEELTGLPAIKLPSTSPANARYRLGDLLAKWEVILEYL